MRKCFRSAVNSARTWSFPGFPGADTGSDHDLLMMTFHLHLKMNQQATTHKTQVWNKKKLKDPNVLKTFQAMIGRKFTPLTIMSNEDTDIDSMITTFNTAVTETASEILSKNHQKKNPGSLQKFLICVTKGENWESKNSNPKDLRNTRIEEIWGRTTVRGHTNSFKTLPVWNKGKLLLSKIVQENDSHKNECDEQNTAQSCTITRPMVINQYWTVPRHTQRTTIPSFEKKWRLQYNYWRKGSWLEPTTSQHNWSKQVERM